MTSMAWAHGAYRLAVLMDEQVRVHVKSPHPSPLPMGLMFLDLLDYPYPPDLIHSILVVGLLSGITLVLGF